MLSEIKSGCERSTILKVFKSQLVTEQSGFILGLVLIFFLIFTILGYGLIEMAGHESIQVVKYYNRMQAFYNAEAGIHKSLWLLNCVSAKSASFSDGTVKVTYHSSKKKIISQGIAGKTNYSIEVLLEQDNPFRHIISYQDKLKLDKKDVTLAYQPGHEPKKTSNFPLADMSYYKSIADTIIKAGKSGKVKLSGKKWQGVIFVNGKVELKKGTKVLGTVVATGSIKLKGAIEIKAQQVPFTNAYYPAFYPAIICGSSKDIEVKKSQTIQGTIYSLGEVEIEKGVCTGPIVADEVEVKKKSILSDASESKYYVHPPGFIYPFKNSGDLRIKSGGWKSLGTK